MRTVLALFFIALLITGEATACPTGMLFNGNGCSPPYEYSMNDWIREQREYIDSLGPKGPPVQGLTAEETRAMLEGLADQEKVNQEKRRAHAAGIWHVDKQSTPEGTLCMAIFSKYTLDDGGVVGIMGFQSPKREAWLIFYGVGLPKPRNVTKVRMSLKQDDEDAQTAQVFTYRLSKEVGAVAFAVPGLSAVVDGMRDEQRFELSLDGKRLLSIKWSGGAKAIEQLRQCVR